MTTQHFRFIFSATVFFLLSVFTGCKKDIVSEPAISSLSINSSVQPITVDVASNFLKNKFGSGNSMMLHSAATSLTSVGDVFLPSDIQIKPLWDSALITTYLKVNPLLMVPVENIPLLDADGGGYSLVFSKDSTGKMQSVSQCFVPKKTYTGKVNGNFKVNDFTGMMYQITMDGKIQKMVKVNAGKILGELSPGKLAGTEPPVPDDGGCSGPGDCYGGFGCGLFCKIGNFFTGLGNAIGGLFNSPNTSNTNSGNNNGYTDPSNANGSISYGSSGSNTNYGNSSGGGGIGTDLSYLAVYGDGMKWLIDKQNRNKKPDPKPTNVIQSTFLNNDPSADGQGRRPEMLGMAEDFNLKLNTLQSVVTEQLTASDYASVINKIHNQFGQKSARIQYQGSDYVVYSVSVYYRTNDAVPDFGDPDGLLQAYDHYRDGQFSYQLNSSLGVDGGREVDHTNLLLAPKSINDPSPNPIINAYRYIITNRADSYFGPLTYPQRWIEMDVSIIRISPL